MTHAEAMALVRARQLAHADEASKRLSAARFFVDATASYLREYEGVQISRSDMFCALDLIQCEIAAALSAIEGVLR